MDDTKKQESQKTVVSFVAGLLIGGLLVWVFMPTPDAQAPANEEEENTGAALEEENETAIGTTPTSEVAEQNAAESQTDSTSTNDAVVEVAAQPAGTVVTLTDVRFPAVEGWVAVHEYSDGALGNALGAARFNTAAGLTPSSVTLLRGTVAGGTYAVVFYSDNGDRIFDLRTDSQILIDGSAAAATFTAL